MKVQTLKIKVTLIQPMLGTCSGNPELHEEFVASKSADASKIDEEMAALPSEKAFEKALTLFPRNERGDVILWDYQYKGFVKEAIGALADLGEVPFSKWAYKRVVDRYLFVEPRKIVLLDPAGKPYNGKLDHFTRPLRATTMQGDRVALATSERIPEGTWFHLELTLLGAEKKVKKVEDLTLDHIKAALNYGRFKGLLQWANGGFGRFTWEEIK